MLPFFHDLLMLSFWFLFSSLDPGLGTVLSVIMNTHTYTGGLYSVSDPHPFYADPDPTYKKN